MEEALEDAADLADLAERPAAGHQVERHVADSVVVRQAAVVELLADSVAADSAAAVVADLRFAVKSLGQRDWPEDI